jgi:hypothetical protein
MERMNGVLGAKMTTNSLLASFPRASGQRWERHSRETSQIIRARIAMTTKEKLWCLMFIQNNLFSQESLVINKSASVCHVSVKNQVQWELCKINLGHQHRMIKSKASHLIRDIGGDGISIIIHCHDRHWDRGRGNRRRGR